MKRWMGAYIDEGAYIEWKVKFFDFLSKSSLIVYYATREESKWNRLSSRAAYNTFLPISIEKAAFVCTCEIDYFLFI